MRMSDSSGQEAVMSQRANGRSLCVPGFRSARSNLAAAAPISLSCHSNAPPLTPSLPGARLSAGGVVPSAG